MSAKKTGENPLVPDAMLRRMYEVMVSLRGMEPAARRRGERSRRGEEACRASSLLACGAGDLVSEAGGGGEIEAVLLGRRGAGRGAAKEGPRWLPVVSAPMDRLIGAVGAASVLRLQGGGRLLLAYVGAGEMTAAQWKRVLGMAGEGELPMVFFVLPTMLPEAVEERQGWLSDRAQGWGVPGMPVDAADGVALYRVMQESVTRARGGDGPALVEGVAWRPQGGRARREDGVKAMRRLLEARGLLPRAH